MKKLLIVLILVISFGCSSKKIADQPVPVKAVTKPVSENVAGQSVPESGIEEKYGKLLQEGYKNLLSRNTKESIDKYFNPIIEAYNTHYGNNGKRVYCSRGQAETLFYLLEASKNNEDAVVISYLWSNAFYFKGYASLDLGKIEEAITVINKAIELSPLNSMYLSELGHIYQTQRKWNEAMDLYKRAEESANEFSPEHVKNTELTRALRGIGYSLIELGRLDEAEEKYKKCLEINKNDKKAINELKYIQSIRDKNNS